ncbi:aminodeoxychorismate synthase, component I [Rhizocola hellebori]|uniref:aminodeoxychorismate synthase n=1 Tax=Rhizocola hellebori TaxID=1392758 RepID=A0A8J3Q6V4_9ACTN|nr:aminodeoxychorismate synthase component I [Rhizocola hellebori]GIH05148.1 aminodeoxychorismate synthase, component I [Rhizocola hellebori]
MTRTLLVDNYDSYTYNLFQLIAGVNGIDPVVVHNDDPRTATLDVRDFDNVVISPGPGSPDRERDFGVSARIIAEAQVPILGVCLGHQGIGYGFGADVVRAPAPRHGHLTAVRHEGTGVFSGLPQNFTAVRYHSLCVEDLPDDLIPTAWAEDGVLMGLRHTGLPLWGVQFHPESIATEYGRAMMANFQRITKRFHRRSSTPRLRRNAATAAASSALSTPEGAVEKQGNFRLRVYSLGYAVDGQAAFEQNFSSSPYAFWLDSARVEPVLSRFSFLGDASGPLSEVVRYRIEDAEVEVTASGQPPRRVAGDIFGYLQQALKHRRVFTDALPFDFNCGYVGYFGYELKADLGSVNRHRSPTADSCWIFADRLIVIDHEQQTTYLVCLTDGSAAIERESQVWLSDIAAGLLALPRHEAGEPPRPPATDSSILERYLVRPGDRYVRDVLACQEQLVAGESYEICLTDNLLLPRPDDGFSFYAAMRRYNPAPYAAYLRLGEVEVACSSPERFLRLGRDRVVETKPIKGTAPRGATAEDDQRLLRELANSPKTRAENLMIVDLLRNDLGRVCEIGSVVVPKLMATETYASVHQLVSTIQGRLRPDLDIIDCIRACFPGGSMTGAPKLRTLEIIDTLETEARGIYSGAIGFLAVNGTADLNIVIRTAVMTGEWMRVGAGGAIVLDSDPLDEYQEMLLKAAAPLRAMLAGALEGGDAGDHSR